MLVFEYMYLQYYVAHEILAVLIIPPRVSGITINVKTELIDDKKM